MSKFTAVDKLFFKYLVKTRGHICEIHNRECSNIGTLHILGKGTYPRLRYNTINCILSGWFCSHFYMHHNSDDPRAIYAKKRILELRGYVTWEALRDDLKLKARISPKVDLKMLSIFFKNKLEAK